MAKKNIDDTAKKNDLGVRKDAPEGKADKAKLEAAKNQRFYRRWGSSLSTKLAPVTNKITPVLPSTAVLIELLAEGTVLGSAVLFNQHGATVPAFRDAAIAIGSSTLVMGGLRGAGTAITNGSAYAYNTTTSYFTAADKPAADKPAADKPAADKPAADKPVELEDSSDDELENETSSESDAESDIETAKEKAGYADMTRGEKGAFTRQWNASHNEKARNKPKR